MATKQEKAVQRAVKREKKRGVMREERHILWVLLALILLLLYLLAAQHYDWWPYARPKLGSAFYTNISPTASQPKSAASSSGGSNDSGSSGGSTTPGGSGSTNSGGSGAGGSSPTTPSGTPSIATFAAGVNVGNTKAQTSGHATGLGQACAVVVNAHTSNSGQQQVCTYTQGNKIVTITYLDNHVISASKSGF
jgi:hypothetical protein